jgi:hypothetical protein
MMYCWLWTFHTGVLQYVRLVQQSLPDAGDVSRTYQSRK